MTRPTAARPAALTFLIALLLAAAGCGDGGGEATFPDTIPEPPPGGPRPMGGPNR